MLRAAFEHSQGSNFRASARVHSSANKAKVLSFARVLGLLSNTELEAKVAFRTQLAAKPKVPTFALVLVLFPRMLAAKPQKGLWVAAERFFTSIGRRLPKLESEM